MKTLGLVRAYVLIGVALVSACAADASAPVDAGASECTCDDTVTVVVHNCSPQDDGTCVDAGTHEGTLRDFFTYLCPSTPTVTCAGGVYTVTCEGRTSELHTVRDDDDGGACRLDDAP